MYLYAGALENVPAARIVAHRPEPAKSIVGHDEAGLWAGRSAAPKLENGANGAMNRIRFRRFFKSAGPAVLPVVHVLNAKQACRNADMAIAAGKPAERFPDLRAVSFDRGFHSPENRIRLDELLDHNVLPKKGYLNKAERKRERGAEFVAMRGQHPAVESAINNLEHRGLDRVLAHGAMGFAHVVALSVVALNIHRIGLLLRRKARRRRAA